MKKALLLFCLSFFSLVILHAQPCAVDRQITTSDSVLCAGETTLLTFNAVINPIDTTLPTPILNNNGQDGNMFNITATTTIRVRYFEGLIANTPNPTTDYYIYYKVGTHVGFENNSAAWTLIAGPVTVTPNAPNTMTLIPVNINITIPAGQTYAFYLTNTSAALNNNRYHNGTATGNVAATNSDLTIYEGTGGAYPFGTFFNARPWEGIVHYDYPPPSLLWNTGATTASISVQPGATTDYSCVASFGNCTIEDTITVQVNNNPVPSLGPDASICQNSTVVLDAGNPGAVYTWCSGETSQSIVVSTTGTYCVNVLDTNGCSSNDTISVIVNSLPSIAAIGDTICSGSSGTMLATGSGSFYAWNPGSLTGNIVNDSPANTTTYTVTTTDGNGCSDSTTVTMVVNQLPLLATVSDSICAGSTGTVNATGTGISYVWDPGSFTGPVVSDNPSSTTTYTVTSTDVNGCSSVDSAMIVVNSLPSVFAAGDTICAGATGTLMASGSGAMYSWNPGPLSGQTVTDSPSSTTTYTVMSTDLNGCSDTATATMVVNALPTVSVSSFGIHCVDDGAITLSGGSPAGGTYSGPGVSSGSFSPSVAGNGTHTIVYMITDANGCSNSASSTVQINPCTGINAYENSPNGISVYPNPFHESAMVSIDANTVLQNAEFNLYDATGKMVMQLTNVNSNMISINRDLLSNGIYFYRVINNGSEIGNGKMIIE